MNVESNEEIPKMHVGPFSINFIKCVADKTRTENYSM